MHVTILQLTREKEAPYHGNEDEVFAMNEEHFPDGVTEHTGKDMLDDIYTLEDWLGRALVVKGTEKCGSKNVRWLEIDTHRLGPLFEPYFNDVQKAVADLAKMTLADFVSGNSAISDAMYKLKSAYSFDGIYIMDESGSCYAISEWLRDIQSGDAQRIQRFYVHAAYDGDQ